MNQSLCYNLSNIDLAVNKILKVEPNLISFLASRFVFPRNEDNVVQFKDNRSPAQKFSDVINLINGKIQPEMAQLWSDICKYDISHECYFKSGIAYLEHDMKKLQKQYKYNKKLSLDAKVNMPESIKKAGHSEHCKPNNEKCVYLASTSFKNASELMDYLFHNNHQICKVLTIKQNAKMLVSYLFQNANIFYKFLKKCQGILRKDLYYLSAKKMKRLYRTACHHFGLVLPENETKTVFISDLTSVSLPFAKGFIRKESSKTEFKELSLSQFLLDSGSDTSILSYKDYRKFNINERNLRPCGQFNLKGSTGVITDCFLGYVQLKLYLEAQDNKFYYENVKFYVAKESLEIPNILGVDFLKQVGCNMSFKGETNIEANMKDYCSKDCIIKIKKLKSSISHFANLEVLEPGSSSVTFHLQNLENYIGEAECQSEILKLPLIDFSDLEKVICYKNKIIRQKEENLEIKIPLLCPVERKYEMGEIETTIKSCFFIGQETKSQLFEVNRNEDDRTRNNIQECQGSEPKFRLPSQTNNPAGQPSSLESKASSAGSWDIDMFQEECNTEKPGYICPSLSNEVARQFEGQEILSFEKNSEDIVSFLAQKRRDEYSADQNISEYCHQDIVSFLAQKRRDEYSADQNISGLIDELSVNKISINSTSEPEKGIKINTDQISHLSRPDQKRVQELVNKYKSFWATSKHQVGQFRGWKAEIELKEGASAYQKERKIARNMEQGVKDTMSGLEQAGVFSLSTGEHSRFCSNQNIVPKLESTDELRLLSKADRHVAKMGQKANTASGFRAAFDYSTLNTQLKDVGKLSLPTLTDVEQAVKNCHVSSIDLKNQYFSIELHNESRTKTNFYYRNQIFMHNRLPMGLASSPYIATMAMKYTFNDAVLEKFKEEMGYSMFEFKSYDDFLKYYLDDCIIFTSKHSKNVKYSSNEIHLIALESVIFALNQEGWIGSLKKANFMSDELVFLGEHICTKTDTSRIQESRIKSILAWRHPKSQAEAGSRMSCLSYFQKFIPALRLIGLPIFQCIKSENFVWGKLQAESFENLKFVISLLISLNHYDPNKILLITADASQVGMNASYFNYTPETGELLLLETQTKLFSKSEINYAPVAKESRAFMFALAHGESLIRNNTLETWVLSDSSSIQHIARNKNYNSRQYTDAIYVSSLPRLNIFYVNGKSLLLSDVLSRQFQSVYLKNNFELSKHMAKIITPLQNLNIQDFTKISNENLVDYILSNPREELVDVWPKKFRYAQPVHKTQLHNKTQNIASEIQLLLGLRLGFQNEAILTLPVWKSILESKGDISKSLAHQTLKVNNLSKLHQKIQSLNLNDEVLQKMLDKFNFAKIKTAEPAPGGDKMSGAVYVAKISKCKNLCTCAECNEIEINNSFSLEAFQILTNQINQIEDVIKSCCNLLKFTCPDEISNYSKSYEGLKCADAKNKLSFLFFQFLIWILNKNKFTISSNKNNNETTKVSFIPYHISDNFTVKIEKGNFNIYNKETISIESLNTKKLETKLLIGYSGQINSLQLVHKKLTLLNSPVFSGKIFELPNVILCNLTDEEVQIKENSLLFSCQLISNADHVVLNKVPCDILQRTQISCNQHDNFNGLNSLTKVVSKFMSYYEKLYKNPPETKVSECNTLYTASSQLLNLADRAGIREKLHPSFENGATRQNFATQSSAISKLLLGQELLQNNNLFSNSMLEKCQLDDPKLTEIILDLKSEKPKNNKKFLIKNNVLYKIQVLFGNKIHYKLCLPNYLAEGILNYHHHKLNNHFNINQTKLYFESSFYCTQLDFLARQVVGNCVICQICQNSYKRKKIGDTRTFEADVTPGKVICSDIIYLPRDNLTNDKFIVLFTDRLTSFVCGIPIKSLNSTTVANAMYQYLCFYPSPKIVQVDGGPEYSGRFQQLCDNYQILVKTSIPRSSQTNGTVESSVKSIKNILTKICASAPQGINNWTALLPIALCSLNNRHPYSANVSRAQMQLSPFFHNVMPFLVSPEPWDFDPFHFEKQKENYSILNKIRKANLKKVASKILKPSNFILKAGIVVTDSNSKKEKIKINGSRALSPGSLRLFKILEVQNNGMSALARNLKDGKISTHSINNLRSIDVNDLMSLQINPEFAFKDVMGMSRHRNLHGKFLSSTDDVQENDRSTRSGSTYCAKNESVQRSQVALPKSILKIKKSESENFYSCTPAQKLASIRGMLLSKQAGNKLSKEETSILAGRHSEAFSQSQFTVPNLIQRKGKSKKKISWNNDVSCLIDNNLSIKKINDEEPAFRACNFSLIALTLDGIMSLKETQLLG